MSIVKDMSLAPSGHQKIQWVRDFMPALSGIEERFRREKPFQGLTIAVSVHLEAKTANLGLVQLGQAASALTEALRGSDMQRASALYPETAAAYREACAAIGDLETDA